MEVSTPTIQKAAQMPAPRVRQKTFSWTDISVRMGVAMVSILILVPLLFEREGPVIKEHADHQRPYHQRQDLFKVGHDKILI